MSRSIPATAYDAALSRSAGIGLAGGWDNIVRHNLITKQKHAGVLLQWLITPSMNNQIASTSFRNTAHAKAPGDADVSIDALGVQNCVDHNVHLTGAIRTPATVDPHNPVGVANCGSDNAARSNLGRGVYQPGDPLVDVISALNAAAITEPKNYTGPGRHPEAQLTMANPCAGAPANPVVP